MVLDVNLNGESISFQIDNPHRPDLKSIFSRIERFAESSSVEISALDVRGLVHEMIKGVAGCESGCPADAKGLVSRGYRGFELKYIEGGILSAYSELGGGTELRFNLFPDF